MKKRTMWVAIALIMMATAALTGCSSDIDNQELTPEIGPVVPPTTMNLTRAEQEMVDQSNEFSFNLFRMATMEGESGPCFEPPKSVILSPISITYALGMLNNGAAGETLAQINKVLGFEKAGADSINAFCYKMLNMVSSNTDPLTKVMIANNIYVNKIYELNPYFVQKAETFYNAHPETRDFNDGKTVDVINQWASDHTEQMIDKVLDDQTFDPSAVSYLLNAIYFKGTWTYKFDKAETKDEVFDHPGWTEELMYRPMMHQQAEFEYAENDDFQALRLPFGSKRNDDALPGCSFVMTVLLPKAQANVLPMVPTAQEWQQLNQKMQITKADVKLPRFENDTDIDLKPIMTKLGMPDAFDLYKADFPYFCNTEVFISLMKQVAKIKLDEEGTEAAAVTVIAVNEKASISGPNYLIFHANHPFLYVISEQQTGAIFFIGQYTGY